MVERPRQTDMISAFSQRRHQKGLNNPNRTSPYLRLKEHQMQNCDLNVSEYFHENPSTTFPVILQTDKQTDTDSYCMSTSLVCVCVCVGGLITNHTCIKLLI